MGGRVGPSGEQWTIASAGHEAVVVEVGGGLRSYAVDGVPVIDGYAEDQLAPGSAGQILAPWPNRIRDGRYTFAGTAYQLPLTEPDRHNAIHGLVNWSRWRATDAGPGHVTVEHDLPPQPGYPWALALRTTWRVGPEGLEASHTATNLDVTPCPFGFAVHPYFALPDVAVTELALRVPARNRLLLDGRLLPIGAARVTGGEFDFAEPRRIGSQELDTTFGDLIRDEDGRSTVTLSALDSHGVLVWADSEFGWWQVYTGAPLSADRHRRAIAVEPMTCPPDAFRSGRDLVVLEPGEVWQGAWGIRPLLA
jgi:aldose 1-epimerase